ncbi:MAG: YncE family protein, partial [Nitrospira sp.]
TSNGADDAWIARWNSDGALAWVRQIGGTGDERFGELALDTLGNVSAGGALFSLTIDMNPGPGTATHTNAGGYDIMVLKLDPAGNHLWSDTMGGTYDDLITGLAVDRYGAIHLSGNFGGTTDLDPTGGVQQRVSAGSNDAFLAKWDVNGNFVWGHAWGGTGNDRAEALVLSPDERTLYAVNYNPGATGNSVTAIDTESLLTKATIGVGVAPVAAAITPDGKWLYVANLGHDSVSVIDTASNKAVATTKVGHRPRVVAVTPDGRRVYIVNSEGSSVSVLSTDSNQVTATIPVGLYPTSTAFSRDGSRLYIANTNDETLSVILTADNKVKATVKVGEGPTALAVDTRDRFLYVANSASNSVSVVDVQSDAVKETIPVGGGPVALGLSHNDKTLYVVNRLSDTVSYITLGESSPKPQRQVYAGNAPQGLALSPDGLQLYVVNPNSNIVTILSSTPPSE